MANTIIEESINPTFYNLSSLVNNHYLFIKLASNAYSVTDYLCKDYSNYFKWFWLKEIPRVFNGTGEIIICTVDDNIAGVSFLKNEENEKKICTFLVVESYRGKHISEKLLERSFACLGTTKPVITIADYKVPMFKHIISQYEWELTQIIDKGYCNNNFRECVYNGFPKE